MKTKSGFTLAEILITLGIIGVVAAITLPTLLNNAGDRVNINKLKREYSLFQQAFQQIAAENDVDFKNGISHCAGTSNKHACLKDVFKAKLKTTVDCDSNNGANLSKCFVEQADAKQLNGNPVKNSAGYFNNNTTAGLILDDGASASVWLDTAECNSTLSQNKVRCGWMVIDVNGPKLKPNTWGKDLFLFFIYSNRIVPADGRNLECTGDDCDKDKDDCGVGTNYGMTCAGKYLYK